MKNTTINMGVIRKIANALKEINQRVVYVGGAVVSLYINDAAADDVRPTKDVDISLEILTVGELEKLRLDLIAKGFFQTADEKVICRFRYEDIKVDVMSTHAVGWAPSDRWFSPGFKCLEEILIEDTTVRILPLAYFLAAKFDAFHDRGNNDARTSHDFEDITYILDNRTDLITHIINSPEDVKTYLQSEFQNVIKNSQMQEAILGNLFYETQAVRYKLIIDKLKKMIK